jgi:hypothetical protein
MRSDCARGSRCPSLASERRHCCDLAVHTGRLQYRSCHRAGRSVKSRRAVCAHVARCPSLGVGRRRSRCALAVHIGRLQYRSRHCAGRSFKSRRVHGALMVLDALFGVRPPPQLCSRRPHWTFVPLSPSCKAGSFKSRRARSAHGSRCPSLASAAPLCRSALAVHIGRLYRSCHHVKRSYKSRRARCALMVLDALFGVRPPPQL